MKHYRPNTNMIGGAELGRPLARWQVQAGRCEIVLIICLEIPSPKQGAIFSGADISHPPNECIYSYHICKIST